MEANNPAAKNRDRTEQVFHNFPQEYLSEFAACGINIHSEEFLTCFPAWVFEELHARGWCDEFDHFFYSGTDQRQRESGTEAEALLKLLKRQKGR